MDPLPFTTPDAPSSRSHQPTLTLNSYPLPDGNWRWVSKSWMIDMRHEGEVQYDGFEYNWRFRKHGWRSHGGFVRRRMWVRLMMKPGKAMKTKKDSREGNGVGVDDSATSSASGMASSLSNSPSGAYPGSEMADNPLEQEIEEVWKGDPDQDWERCHSLMKRLGRDGRKIELWRLWLGGRIVGKGDVPVAGKMKQWREDEHPLPNDVTRARQVALAPRLTPPNLEHVKQVLIVHARTLLHSFMYPETRSELIELLAHARLLPELNLGLSSEMDFYSYMSNLDKAETEDSAEIVIRDSRTKRGKVDDGLWSEEEWKWAEDIEVYPTADAGRVVNYVGFDT